MEKKYLSEVIKEHKSEIFDNNNLVLITAGVGAGKNTWVQKELTKDLKDDETILLITSRKMITEQSLNDSAFCDNLKIAIENHYHYVTTFHKLVSLIFNGSQINKKNFKKLESLNYKYIVIDEVHSLFADSGFANATYYFSIFINWLLNQEKKIICMSATTKELAPYFRKFGNIKSFDFTNECYNVKPKKVEITNLSNAKKLLSQANEENKMLYMANSATKICTQFVPDLIKNHNVKEENIGILISDTAYNSQKQTTQKEVKNILNNMHTINNYIVENEAFPENINIIIATSKIREGINLKDSKIKAMFCESHNPIDIIQFSGRYRKEIENYYIIDDSYNQISARDIEQLNIENDLLSNLLLESINFYYSVLIYKTTKNINHMLQSYINMHNISIESFANWYFSNAFEDYINFLTNIKVHKITGYTASRHNYKLKNYSNILELMHNKELNRFITFITDKFNLLRYNPILEKFEIYHDSYYYKKDSFESYKKYKNNPEDFVKEVLQVPNVTRNILSISNKNNKQLQKHVILKFLSDNNLLSIRLDREKQDFILSSLSTLKSSTGKPYSQLGRLFSAYKIAFESIGAHAKNDIIVTEKYYV